MSYRDLDGYDPHEPMPEPPEAPARAPRRRSGKGWAYGIAGLLVLAATFRLGAMSDDEAPVPESAASQPVAPSSSAVEPVAPSSSPSETPTTQEKKPDPRAARRAAKAFLAEWVKRDRSPDDWHAKVAPLATSTFGNALAMVNPANVPATKVERVQVETITTTSGEVIATTDGPTVRLLMERAGGQWLVSSIEPVRQDEQDAGEAA